MGGSRCSYRNCTVRSDGTTHMFHYPVFDKVRCHQWLTNSRKLEFLYIKLSQLKNKVICQHHFKDTCFMNFRKNKLKFDAVPTEDGPYCDPSQYDTNDSEEILNPISLDDIDNDYSIWTDKKANYSVKYGDFLTNSDIMDMQLKNNSNRNTEVDFKKVKSNKIEAPPILYNVEPQINNTITSIQDINIPSLPDYQTATLTFELDNQQSYGKNIDQYSRGDYKYDIPFANTNKYVNNTVKSENSPKIKILSEEKISEPVIVEGKLEPLSPSLIIRVKKKHEHKQPDSYVTLNELNDSINTNKYVNNTVKSENSLNNKILTEEKISEPVLVEGKLEPLSPSLIIRVTKKHEHKQPDSYVTLNEVNDSVNTNVYTEVSGIVQSQRECFIEPQNVSSAEKLRTSLLQDVWQNNSSHKTNSEEKIKITINNAISPNKVLFKKKNNLKNVAAIEEKRKFNKKLRDIIESCFENTDEQEKKCEETLHKNAKLETNIQVSDHLSKDPDLPNLQEYTIACLESRLKNMENLLLNKIDQNSQRIMELKNSIQSPDKKSPKIKKLVFEDSHKRQLYQEISQFLSPAANSMIYEELFINKYTQKAPPSCQTPKRRRKR